MPPLRLWRKGGARDSARGRCPIRFTIIYSFGNVRLHSLIRKLAQTASTPCSRFGFLISKSLHVSRETFLPLFVKNTQKKPRRGRHRSQCKKPYALRLQAFYSKDSGKKAVAFYPSSLVCSLFHPPTRLFFRDFYLLCYIRLTAHKTNQGHSKTKMFHVKHSGIFQLKKNASHFSVSRSFSHSVIPAHCFYMVLRLGQRPRALSRAPPLRHRRKGGIRTACALYYEAVGLSPARLLELCKSPE